MKTNPDLDLAPQNAAERWYQHVVSRARSKFTPVGMLIVAILCIGLRFQIGLTTAGLYGIAFLFFSVTEFERHLAFTIHLRQHKEIAELRRQASNKKIHDIST